MRKFITVMSLFLLTSCGGSKVVYQKDITHNTEWLESTKDNPIINVIQKVYQNDDVEIVIKKKLTTDYVKLRLRGGKRTIKKTTEKN